MQDERRLDVLRAIVEDYVATQEPVGSKALVERHGLGVSPATVRNDMAALEEEGLITQPHTSAGRIPTDKGYRLFVDRLTTIKPMTPAERRAIATILDGAVDLDDVVAAVGAAAGPADPPGRDRAVPDAVPLHGPARRAGRAGSHPAARGADPQLGPGGAAAGRSRRRARRRRLAALRARLAAAAIGRTIADASHELELPRRRRPATAGVQDAVVDERWSRRCPTTARPSGWPWAARPTWPGSATASSCRPAAPRGARGARRPAQAARRGPDAAAWSRSGSATRGPTRSSPAPASSRPATAPPTRPLGNLGVVGPHPHGLPRDDGGGARGRPLRLPHPRRGIRTYAHVRPRSLRAARRLSGRRRRDDQEGLPPAGPAASPRRQPRPGDAGAVQGGLARLRGAQRPAEAGGVRPRRRRVRPARRRLRRRASPSPTSWTRSSAVRPGPAGPRSATAQPPRPGRPDPDGGHPGGGGVRRHPRAQGRHRRRCTTCDGEGTAPGTHPVPCETCRGTGEVAHVQRSFLGEIRTLRPCSACRGYGTLIPDPCRECSGDGRVRARRSITVKIPAGVDTGTRVQLAGQGEVGAGGGPAGDLYVEVHVAPARGLHPRGHDLHCAVTVPMTAAALGTTLTLPTLEADVEQRRHRGGDVVRARPQAGHPVGERAHVPRTRGPGAARRPRRPRGDRRGRDADPARPAAGGAHARARRDPRRGEARRRPRATRPSGSVFGRIRDAFNGPPNRH